MILHVDVRARAQQHLHDLEVAILSGNEQRCITEFIAYIDRNALGQDGCNLFVSTVASARKEKAKSVSGWGGAWRTGAWKDD